MNDQVFRSGFVSLIGRPNSGKSTLLNRLAGMRLAITSPKAQTTRQVVRAVIDQDDSQIIFLDTPGLHKPRSRLGEYMMAAASVALSDGDVILLMVDAVAAAKYESGYRVPDVEQAVLDRAKGQGKPVILLLNKIDWVNKAQLLPLMAAYSNIFPFKALIPVSAKTGDGLDRLVDEIKKLLSPGPRYFPIDSLTDQTERSLAAELIREQILFLTSEEIPHGTAVEIDTFEERLDNDQAGDGNRNFVYIRASIYCDKDSHKGILIGRQGHMLKNIGTAARVQIEYMIGCPCYLDLYVKVREGWRNRQGILRNLGYEMKAGRSG